MKIINFILSFIITLTLSPVLAQSGLHGTHNLVPEITLPGQTNYNNELAKRLNKITSTHNLMVQNQDLPRDEHDNHVKEPAKVSAKYTMPIARLKSNDHMYVHYPATNKQFNLLIKIPDSTLSK